MLYINIIFLIALSAFCGFVIGKGKIEIVRKVEPTQEQKDKIEKQLKIQQEAIEKYNEMVQSLTNYQ
jgi:ABC-type dipeptide/oligopeptide/nickel transport system permease component